MPGSPVTITGRGAVIRDEPREHAHQRSPRGEQHGVGPQSRERAAERVVLDARTRLLSSPLPASAARCCAALTTTGRLDGPASPVDLVRTRARAGPRPT